MKIIESYPGDSNIHGFISFLDKNNQKHKIIIIQNHDNARLYYFNIESNSRYLHDDLLYNCGPNKSSQEIINELKELITSIDFYDELSGLLDMESVL